MIKLGDYCSWLHQGLNAAPEMRLLSTSGDCNGVTIFVSDVNIRVLEGNEDVADEVFSVAAAGQSLVSLRAITSETWATFGCGGMPTCV